MDPIIIVIIAAVVLIWMFLRTRKPRNVTPMPQRLSDREAELAPPPEPQWHLRDLGPGARIHLSLPKGLEEDFAVLRRDRVDRSDERVEYDLVMAGDDPANPVRIVWWKIGTQTHAWLVEPAGYGIDRLGLTADRIAAMRTAGSVTVRDVTYSLAQAGTLVVYPGGQRPGREVDRWDFRDAKGTRMVLVEFREWEAEKFTVSVGQELWLRDLTVVSAAPPAEGGISG